MSSPYSYVTFPLRDPESRQRFGDAGSAVREGVEFLLTLILRFREGDDDAARTRWRQDIDAALWAWETFGGVGARTRRGFGAVQCIEIDGSAPAQPPVDRVREMLAEGLATHVLDGAWPRGVPHLTRTLKTVIIPAQVGNGSPTAADAAWRKLIRRLKDFRQYRLNDEGRRSPFGNSAWPEADAIRFHTGRASAKHESALSDPGVDRFPRAAFGLPIVFKFKGGADDHPPGLEPAVTTLQPREHDRLASPLLLRPLACADNRAVGLALVLQGTDLPSGGLILKGSDPERTVEPGLTAAEARKGKVAPLKEWVEERRLAPGAAVNVLDACLAYMSDPSR